MSMQVKPHKREDKILAIY